MALVCSRCKDVIEEGRLTKKGVTCRACIRHEAELKKSQAFFDRAKQLREGNDMAKAVKTVKAVSGKITPDDIIVMVAAGYDCRKELAAHIRSKYGICYDGRAGKVLNLLHQQGKLTKVQQGGMFKYAVIHATVAAVPQKKDRIGKDTKKNIKGLKTAPRAAKASKVKAKTAKKAKKA